MKQTARAVLTNSRGLCFLAIHNHFLPENIGKWGTVGGLMDPEDADVEACLRRELTEEFAGVSPEAFEVRGKLAEFEHNGVLHHFFHVRTTLAELQPSQPEEILQSGFFTFAEVEAFKTAGRLYFDLEDELYARAFEK